MTFLPILERELRVRARWRSTFRVRAGGALLSILVAGGLLVGTQGFISPNKAGLIIFRILAGLAFLGCLLEGTRVTADCLSEEKRNGTLGLLFLSSLKGYDVVLGKFMAASLNSFYSLLAVLPALAIPITLGGVTGGEFWRLVLLLLNTLFFSLSLGILVSTLSVQEARAWLASLGLMAWFVIMGPLVGMATLPLGTKISSFWVSLSPLVGFYSLFDGPFMSVPARFWLSLGAFHFLGWLCLALASLLLPKTWRTDPAPLARPGPVRRQRRSPTWSWDHFLPGILPLGTGNPLTFLTGFFSPRPWLPASVVGLLAGGGLIWWSLLGFVPELGAFLGLWFVGIHLLLAGWMAAQASRLMAFNRDSGMLELLLTTSLTTREIGQGLYLGLWRNVARPVMVLGMLELYGLAIALTLFSYSRESPWSAVPLFLLIGSVLVVTLMDLAAAARFGLWMGLTTPKPAQAWVKTWLLVVVLPALTSPCCLVLWPVLALVKNLVFMHMAAEQLQNRLRAVVGEGFPPGQDLRMLTDTGSKKKKRDVPLPSVLPG